MGTSKTTTLESEADITMYDDVEIDPETESQDADADGDEKNYSAVYALIAIIIILALIALVMYLLHYKGKLPQTFYNLGRRQWKFVQANEDAIIDDDEKKHPEIVKNGKNWKMAVKM